MCDADIQVIERNVMKTANSIFASKDAMHSKHTPSELRHIKNLQHCITDLVVVVRFAPEHELPDPLALCQFGLFVHFAHRHRLPHADA